MKSILLSLAIFCYVRAQEASLDSKEIINPVWKLTETNMTAFLGQHPMILVSFCTPWALQCKDLAQEFLIMSRLTYPYPIQLATVDTSTQIMLALEYKIKNHPSIALFHGEKTFWYDGLMVYPNINRWINKMRQELVIPANSTEEIDKISGTHLTYLLANSIDSPELNKLYLEISAKNKEILFMTASVEAAKNFLKTPQEFNLVAIRKFDDGNKVLSSKLPFKKEEIENFLNQTAVPHVFQITEETLDNTMRKRINTAICIYQSEDSPYLKFFKKMAAEKISNLAFIASHMNTEHGTLVSSAIEMGNSWEAIRVVEYMEGYERLFKFHKKPTEENVRKFFEEYNRGELSLYASSQDPFKENNGVIYNLVASEFDDFMSDESRSVILYLYEDNCPLSNQINMWLEKEIKLIKKSKEVVYAQMNMSHNVHPDIPVSKLPAFFAYVKRRKNHPVFMTETHSEVGFRVFLKRAILHKFERSGKIDDVEESL